MRVGETWKAHPRRLLTGWFDLYAPPEQPGIDIGPDCDPLNHTFRRWHYEKDGDATEMRGVPDNTFQTTYISHVLEHVNNPILAIRNWYRVTKSGGHLIILVPHRDMYEKRKTLPSKWNPDHKTFWLPDTEESPVTKSLMKTIMTAIPNANVVSFTVLDEGFVSNGPDSHSEGEYSIEAIIKKS